MISDIKKDAEARMKKAIEALGNHFNKIRTGRAHPSILDGITVNYYGTDTPLSQLANINVEDARTLSVSPWERNLVPEIEKAILKSNLGLNPSTNNGLIRLPLPMLTEETRKNFIIEQHNNSNNCKNRKPRNGWLAAWNHNRRR